MKYPPEVIYEKILEGDDEAWGIVRAYVYKIIIHMHLRLRGEDNEDLTHIVLLKLLERIASGNLAVNDPTAFIRFLFIVTRNRILDYVGSRGYQNQGITDPIDGEDDTLDGDSPKPRMQIPDPGPGQDWSYRFKKALDILKECVEELNEDDKRLFYLKVGKSTPEVKQELKLIKGHAVKYTRLKDKLKASFEKKMAKV